MLIVKRLGKYGDSRPGSVVALGVFDGLHRGHRAIISRLISLARSRGHDSAVVTFDPPPQAVLLGKDWPGCLTTLAEKEKMLEAAGIDVLAVIRFDRRVARLSAEEFVKKMLVDQLRASHVVCGSDCGFGRARSGNLKILKALGRKYGFQVTEVRPLLFQGKKIGSRNIKRLIRKGEVALARRMLGRPYSISGRAVKGQGLGRKLGFPTINLRLDPQGKLLPAHGVYAATAGINNRVFLGLLYIGSRPTIAPGGDRRIEFHSLKARPPVKTRGIEIKLHRFIRPERRFRNLEELKLAMTRDAARAARLLGRRASASYL
jgi:riboflavin kinase/FMN adenylyltransferase